MKTIKTIPAYIASLEHAVWEKIQTLCSLVQDVSPTAIGQISYGMPAYKYNGKPLIYFAAFAHHIGIYATPNAHTHFAKQLAWYKQGKWSFQIPLDQPLPIDLIKKMIVWNMKEITQK